MGWRGIAAAFVAAAAVVAGVLIVNGGNDKGSQTTPTTGTTTPTTGTRTTAKTAPGKAGSRKGRQGVRRGHGATPDRPAPGTGPLLAIADQKPQTFADPRFRSIGVARSRLNTPWDSIFTEPARLNQWLQAARADGIEPLIAFEHARGDNCPAAPCSLPSVAAYSKAVAAFHQRYPWVHTLQAWNEANSATQPTGKHPERAAAYYEAAKKVCPGCTITAADVLDSSNLDRWLSRFKAALHGTPTPLWGLHNYSDTNRFRTTGTKRMLAAVNGEIWLTEAGGIVSFTTADGRTALPYDERRAARAIRYLFNLSRLSSRITRIYVYQWKIDFPGNRFDAGLVRPNGQPRPSLNALLQHRSLLR
ncbi:MAG TPA: glycosyl hydrolase [Thermoleophilaceae bacterium]|nr:glycosyl hydrolase [Thermoleophilaceae bacterium]